MTIDEKIEELEQLYLKQTIVVLNPRCPHCREGLGLKTITIWTDDKVKQYRKEVKKIILEEIEKLPRCGIVYARCDARDIHDIKKLLGEK